AEAMTSRLESVSRQASIQDLMPIFARDHVAIVLDGNEFLGFITRIDLLHYLRRKLP
ncbi:MAG TPA: cystathionine beta-synthase, partial [Gammaproteobacteria bacterium]|nr:cystathionine beta-synthase [Gammaproteobacteria bacterium]